MAKRRTHGKVIAGTRLPIPFKEYNKVKKTLEKIVTSVGGSFEDRAINSAVKSTYTLGLKSKTISWHFSPSQKSVNATKGNVMDLLTEIGVLAKMGLDDVSKSKTQQRLKLKKTLDGNLKFPKPVNEYPEEIRDLETAVDLFMSKSAAEYMADAANGNRSWERLIRYYDYN